jgi:hypothetical protein
MKLVRYGAKGAEKPGLVDAQGKIRDLSAHVADITVDTIARLPPSMPPACRWSRVTCVTACR